MDLFEYNTARLVRPVRYQGPHAYFDAPRRHGERWHVSLISTLYTTVLQTFMHACMCKCKPVNDIISLNLTRETLSAPVLRIPYLALCARWSRAQDILGLVFARVSYEDIGYGLHRWEACLPTGRLELFRLCGGHHRSSGLPALGRQLLEPQFSASAARHAPTADGQQVSTAPRNCQVIPQM